MADKMWGPRCWWCSQQKIRCSIVEARKKVKEKEVEVVKVKWTEKRGEEMGMGELKDIMKNMLKAMEQIADGIEGLVEGQKEMMEQQRLMGLGLEKMLRVIEGKDRKWEEERAREWEKVKETEKVVEGEEDEKTVISYPSLVSGIE